MGFEIVPQKIVDVLAPALSTDVRVGPVLAEQVLRGDVGEVIKQLLGSDRAPTAAQLVALPPLVSNRQWADVIAQAKAALSA